MSFDATAIRRHIKQGREAAKRHPAFMWANMMADLADDAEKLLEEHEARRADEPAPVVPGMRGVL